MTALLPSPHAVTVDVRIASPTQAMLGRARSQQQLTPPGADYSACDWALLFFVAILFALPYSRLTSFGILQTTWYSSETLLILISGVAVANLLSRTANTLPMCLLLLLMSLCAAGLVRAACHPPSASAPGHMRAFLPTIAATAVLSSRWSLRTSQFLVVIAASGTVSAIIAMAIHLGWRHQIAALTRNPEMSEVVYATGRMYWSAVPIALILICGVPLCSARARAYVSVGAAVAIGGVLLTQSRTLLFGCAAALAISLTSGSLTRHTRVLIVAAISATTAGAATLLLLDADALTVALSRASLGTLDVGDIGATAGSEPIAGRVSLFEQYADSYKRSPIWGLGLGNETATDDRNNPILLTDVTALNLIMPFGLAGLVAFALLCWACFAAAAKHGAPRDATWLLVVCLALSFNYDLFVKDYFVVALATFLVSRPSHARRIWKGCPEQRTSSHIGDTPYRAHG